MKNVSNSPKIKLAASDFVEEAKRKRTQESAAVAALCACERPPRRQRRSFNGAPNSDPKNCRGDFVCRTLEEAACVVLPLIASSFALWLPSVCLSLCVCAFIVYFAFTKPFIRWLRRKESCELSWNLSIAHDISEGCRRKSRQFGFADCVWIGYFFVHIFCLVLFYRCRLRQCVRLNCRPFGRCHEQNEQAWPRHSNSQPH